MNDKIKALRNPTNIKIERRNLNNSQYNLEEIIFQSDIHTNTILYFISKDVFKIQWKLLI